MSFEGIKKRHLIKIPKNVILLYCDKKKVLQLISPIKKRSLKLEVKISIPQENENFIFVTSIPSSEIPNNKKKKIKSTQGTTIALIKQMLIELSTKIYQKLKLVGVGYKAFNIDNFKNKLLMLKIGLSHALYFKVPHPLSFFCLKAVKIFIYGDFYKKVSQLSSLLKSCKYPDPYKGKGILFVNEKITLKEGKKI